MAPSTLLTLKRPSKGRIIHHSPAGVNARIETLLVEMGILRRQLSSGMVFNRTMNPESHRTGIGRQPLPSQMVIGVDDGAGLIHQLQQLLLGGGMASMVP